MEIPISLNNLKPKTIYTKGKMEIIHHKVRNEHIKLSRCNRMAPSVLLD
jgi:hypothetical protein